MDEPSNVDRFRRSIDEEDSTPLKEDNGFSHPSEVEPDDNDGMDENEEDDFGD